MREFFSVSPLWLRGASAFAGLLLCVLLVFAVSRLWQRPTQVVRTGDKPAIDQKAFEQEVQREVDKRLVVLKEQSSKPLETASPATDASGNQPRVQVAASRVRSKRIKGLSPEEREQLAADLGLIPGREEEFPFVFPDEPNQ